jgi:probable HAF family extracellular repeat protein
MEMKFQKLAIAAFVSSGLAVANGVPACAMTYDVTVLGSLGGSSSGAWAINDSGQAAGASYTAGNASQQAVVWNGTAPTVLGSLGGIGGAAYAINNSGQVAGYSYTAGNASLQAVVWNGAAPTVLGSLGGTYNGASAINNSGQVAGYSWTAGNASQQAVVWNGTAPTVLGSLGGTNSSAAAINDSGQVVGYSTTTTGQFGTIWNGTTAININTLLTSDPSGILLLALTGINSFGQIVGYGSDSSGNWDAVLLTPTSSVSATPIPAALPLFASGLVPGIISH